MAHTSASGLPRARPFQRLIARGARLLARGIYRSVEVENEETGWSRHPVILVANHPTGFSDPALLLGLLERSPRFLAKATLWKTPGLGWFLDRIGAIPVYRAQDGSTARNDEMFAAAFDALRAHDTIALFPEGGAVDAASIGPIKTGAARLALGARAAGIAGLQVVPVGIHYEDKAAVRKRAYVKVGDVIDLDHGLDEWVDSDRVKPEDHQAVQQVTEEIESRLRACAPDHASGEEAQTLSFAGAVALREPTTPWVSYADRERVSARLGQVGSEARLDVVNRANPYAAELAAARVRDTDVMLAQGKTGLRQSLIGVLALLIVLAPFAVAGIILNFLPYVALRAAMRMRHDAMTPSTIRLFAAIFLFFLMWLTWMVVAWSLWDWRMALVTLVACPVYGGVAVAVLDRSVRWWRDWSGRRRVRRLGSGVLELLEQRRLVVSSVEEALAA
ncbi:MAG: hypothetical protein GY926_10520 [bacterium]|nr:hypothetical protein [bacterium]